VEKQVTIRFTETLEMMMSMEASVTIDSMVGMAAIGLPREPAMTSSSAAVAMMF